MAALIQHRRDTATNWSTENPVLNEGEPGWDLTNKKGKMGDGVTPWNSLTYSTVVDPATINDSVNTSTTETWSVDRIKTEIDTAIGVSSPDLAAAERAYLWLAGAERTSGEIDTWLATSTNADDLVNLLNSPAWMDEVFNNANAWASMNANAGTKSDIYENASVLADLLAFRELSIDRQDHTNIYDMLSDATARAALFANPQAVDEIVQSELMCNHICASSTYYSDVDASSSVLNKFYNSSVSLPIVINNAASRQTAFGSTTNPGLFVSLQLTFDTIIADAGIAKEFLESVNMLTALDADSTAIARWTGNSTARSYVISNNEVGSANSTGFTNWMDQLSLLDALVSNAAWFAEFLAYNEVIATVTRYTAVESFVANISAVSDVVSTQGYVDVFHGNATARDFIVDMPSLWDQWNVSTTLSLASFYKDANCLVDLFERTDAVTALTAKTASIDVLTGATFDRSAWIANSNARSHTLSSLVDRWKLSAEAITDLISDAVFRSELVAQPSVFSSFITHSTAYNTFVNSTTWCTEINTDDGSLLQTFITENGPAKAALVASTIAYNNIGVSGVTSGVRTVILSDPTIRAWLSDVRGEQIYEGTATNTVGDWVCPDHVFEVSVVCVGGGGGGNGYTASDYTGGGAGGGLGYKNTIATTPGHTYSYQAGQYGAGDTDTTSATVATNGGDSYFIDATTVKGGGGAKGYNGSSSFRSVGGTYVGDGGGNGGGGVQPTNYPGGGGGAGGYSGNGGDGSYTDYANGGAGSGGGGGAGGNGDSNYGGGGGGGVGLLGEGASGSGGTGSSTSNGYGGGGGSGGNQGDRGGSGFGGLYGGGGGGDDSAGAQSGGAGAVRIVWPGVTRTFPSTDVGAS